MSNAVYIIVDSKLSLVHLLGSSLFMHFINLYCELSTFVPPFFIRYYTMIQNCTFLHNVLGIG